MLFKIIREYITYSMYVNNRHITSNIKHNSHQYTTEKNIILYKHNLCSDLLSRFYRWQCDSLGVDYWQDLVANHSGYNLALRIGQQLRCDWLNLQRGSATPWLAGRSHRIRHQRDGPNDLKRGDKEIKFRLSYFHSIKNMFSTVCE